MSEEKPKKKNWFLLGCGGLIGLFIIIGVISSCSKPSTKTSEDKGKTTSSPTSSQSATTVKMNEDLQVGDVKWKVLEANKENSVGDNQYTKKQASGVFVVVKVSAELTGNKSGTVDSNQFEIIDSKNRTFKYSSEGQTAIEMSGKEGLFLKQVNPNVPIEGYLVFDIAKDAENLKLKIKDLELFSNKEGVVELGI